MTYRNCKQLWKVGSSLIFFSVGCGSLVGEGYEYRIKALDDLADTFITGRFPPLLSWDLHPP